jgi:hypothetical protein
MLTPTHARKIIGVDWCQPATFGTIAGTMNIDIDNRIVITTYNYAKPPRVLWVVLKMNAVAGSGVELAQLAAIDAARTEAVKQAEQCARESGLSEPFQIEYWEGISERK